MTYTLDSLVTLCFFVECISRSLMCCSSINSQVFSYGVVQLYTFLIEEWLPVCDLMATRDLMSC